MHDHQDEEVFELAQQILSNLSGRYCVDLVVLSLAVALYATASVYEHDPYAALWAAKIAVDERRRGNN